MTDLAVGLMSGTSLDGVDAALVEIARGPRVTLLAFHTAPFEASLRETILGTMSAGSARDIALLNVELGARFAAASLDLLASAGVAPAEVAFVASHGLTLWHEPRRATLQIGDPAVIAERVGVQVVSDFRSRDVAAGGEGAPLVPVADAALYGHPEHGRVLLNIGGMANLTWVPHAGASDGIVAFDTGPGVAVTDAVVRRETNDPFDRDGRLGSSGEPVGEVVDALLEHGYFGRPPPKSTGREEFGEAFATRLAKAVRDRRPSATPADVIATAVLLSCRAIARAVEAWVPGGPESDLVVSGGGARNPLYLALLERELGAWAVRRFDDLFFNGDAKEAVAFAYLGSLTLAGLAGNLPEATGAAGPRVLGRITPA